MIVSDYEIFRVGRIEVKHHVRAVWIWSLGVGPANSGVEADIILEEDIFGYAVTIPVLKRVFGVFNQIVSVNDVFLNGRFRLGSLTLIGESRVIDFPDSAIFNEVFLRGIPEFNRVSESDGRSVWVGELMSAPDIVKIAFPDRDSFGIRAAKTVGRSVSDGEIFVNDIVLPALVDDG